MVYISSTQKEVCSVPLEVALKSPLGYNYEEIVSMYDVLYCLLFSILE
jgi:hypothetical protein